MTTPIFWLIPILLIPGLALLILSTATRYAQIHMANFEEANPPTSTAV